MPGGRIVVLHTRWAVNDLIGRLIQEGAKNPKADQWEYFAFPAILPSGKSIWPEQWPVEELERTRESMPLFQWSAQYQQEPTSAEGSIVKAEWLKKWKAEEPPQVEYIIMSLDAAQEKNNRSDFTAFTVWGVFYKETSDGYKQANIILLDAHNIRVDFPELKALSLRLYKQWKPDCFIVEKKSNGAALYQEIRRMGVPVTEFTPSRGQDKIARLNSVADIISSGLVWIPEYRWAEDVTLQLTSFPASGKDDLVDSTVMALMRFRSGGFITLPSDDELEDQEFVPRVAAYY